MQRATKAEGFTLIELIIVVGLLAYIYTAALPNLSLISENEAASRIGQLSEDVRAAYDYSVLTGNPLRMVFQLSDGKYWLESTDTKNVRLGDALVERDLSPEEEKYHLEDFDAEFQEYEDMMGEASNYTDPATGREEEIVRTSPVITAKKKLRGPVWSRLDSLEWGVRDLGAFLFIQDLWAEHHERRISSEDQDADTVAMIYFLPGGYVEKAVIHIAYHGEEGQADPEKAPYTVLTHPYEGIAEVRSGYEDIDIRKDGQN
ncbi:MAG: type II secretion system protein [Deltaproteobacteria bacterium]|nr:type II secretion system protein [Deltaproteobacteria bacterium]